MLNLDDNYAREPGIEMNKHKHEQVSLFQSDMQSAVNLVPESYFSPYLSFTRFCFRLITVFVVRFMFVHFNTRFPSLIVIEVEDDRSSKVKSSRL